MQPLEHIRKPQGHNTDSMSYYVLEDKMSRAEDTDEIVGASIDAEVGFRPDGGKVYVKDADSRSDDIVQSHIAADIYFDHIPSVTPEIAYDDAFGKILVEEMPGEFTEEYDKLDQRSLHRAIAEKLLMGDCDYAGNFLVSGQTVSPIDYDVTGRDLETTLETIDTWLEEDLDEELLYQEASKLADSIDIDDLEQDMRDNRLLMDEWSNFDDADSEPREGLYSGSVDNILENVRTFQDRRGI